MGLQLAGNDSHMGTRITDSRRNLILLKSQYLRGEEECWLNQFYILPWANTESEELQFDNFTTPRSVSTGQEFQVWFVEDLNGCSELGYGPQETCTELTEVHAWHV